MGGGLFAKQTACPDVDWASGMGRQAELAVEPKRGCHPAATSLDFAGVVHAAWRKELARFLPVGA